MKKPAKILLWIVGIVVGLALAAAIVVKVVFTKERILAMVTPRLEEAVDRDVTIGDAGISIWGGIGVWLGDVTVDNKPGFSNEAFLTVHRLEIKARFWPLLAGRVELDRVILDAPSLLLEYNAVGESNLAGLAKSGETRGADTSAAGAGIPDEAALAAPVTVDHFVMNGAQLVIRHEVPQREININGLFMDLITGNPVESTTMTFEADAAVDSVIVTGGERSFAFREGRPEAYLKGFFDRRENLVQFDTVGLTWMGALIAFQGRVQMHDAFNEIQVNAQITPTSLAAMVDQAVLSGIMETRYNIDGELSGDLQGSLNWPLPEGTTPDWSARLYVRDFTWRSPDGAHEITLPTAEIRGERRVVSWNASNCSLPNGSFSTSGTIDRVFSSNRDISARVSLDASLAELMALTDTANTGWITGRVKADLNAFGPLAEWKRLRISGPVRSDRITMVEPSWPVDTVTLAIDWEFTGDDVTIRHAQFNAGHSSGMLRGNVAGIVPAALASFEPPHVPRATLEVTCPYLNFDELLAEEDMPVDTTVTTEGGASPAVVADTVPFSLPAIAARGSFECDTAIFNELTYTAIRAPFTFQDNILTFDPLKGRVLGGIAEGALRYDLNDWDNPSFAVRVDADSIQTNDFLSRYFGWAGGLFGQVRFIGEFTGTGDDSEKVLRSLQANGRALLSDGRLESAPLLANIGRRIGFTDVDEVRTIRDLIVTYRIANGRLFTDTLGMVTDRARWIASGSYGFDGTLDYLINVNLTEAGRQKWAQLLKGSDFEIDLSGTITSPKISVNLAETGVDVLKNVIEQKLTGDSVRIESKARDLLKGLFNKKKGDG
ncbi:MAG: hypothetical protein Kow0074_24700 [Candidatus Zixiibacteriota bacterium]